MLFAYGLLLAAVAFFTVLLEVLIVAASQKFGAGHRKYLDHEEKYLFLEEFLLLFLVITVVFLLGGFLLP